MMVVVVVVMIIMRVSLIKDILLCHAFSAANCLQRHCNYKFSLFVHFGIYRIVLGPLMVCEP
jgi:hypothetical protein